MDNAVITVNGRTEVDTKFEVVTTIFDIPEQAPRMPHKKNGDMISYQKRMKRDTRKKGKRITQSIKNLRKEIEPRPFKLEEEN